jgi:hypothetical protein
LKTKGCFKRISRCFCDELRLKSEALLTTHANAKEIPDS